MKKKILLSIITTLFFITTGVVVLEIHFRRSTAYLLPLSEDKPVPIESDPEFLIKNTSAGRRLVPNANVVIKNHYLSKQDIYMQINSLGFRDSELDEQKKDNEVRILVLGDSITLGDYLPAEEVFVQRAEKYLNDALPNSKIEVINAGVGDIGIKEEVDILEEKGLSTDPNVVVLAFYLNDSRPPFGFPGEIENRGWLRRHSVLFETLYRNWQLERYLQRTTVDRNKWVETMTSSNWSHSRDDFLKLVNAANYDWGAAWNPQSWEEIGKNLDRLKKLSIEKKFKAVVIAFPVVFQIYSDYLENTPQLKIKSLSTEKGFYFLDLLPVLREKKDDDFYFDHAHPKKFANDVIGKTIAEYLIENKILELKK